MSRPDSLAFARCALQKGFITEAQANAAIAACLADPAKTVEQVLMADGAISATKVMAVFGELGGVPEPPKKRYRFGTEIGRGGLGRVVEARDEELDRDVAVKIVLDGEAPELTARFFREAKLAARLDHPNIVPIYDIGREGGKVFLCMKRVQGRELASILADLAANVTSARQAWTRARMLQVFLDVCSGIAYAHSKRVIHRDLTPANIMVGDFGETLILDWGLAKDLSKGSSASATTAFVPLSGTDDLTIMGDILGTPAFMSPEQAGGRTWEVDERTDVYSLGAILFQILTLRPAFDGPNAVVIANVRDGKFERPSKAVKGDPWPKPKDTHGFEGFEKPAAAGPVIPPVLEEICMKAMALRKEERHSTVAALQRDVQGYLEAGR